MTSIFCRLFIAVLFICSSTIISAQDKPRSSGIDSTFYGISASVYIDSLTISASRLGFDIQDFINLMLEDESFYTAFRNLRTAGYTFDNDISYFDKKERLVANYKGTSRQHFDGQCRNMEVISEDITGDFFKKGNYRHYTTRLYDRVFITHGTACESKQEPTEKQEPSSDLEHQISMLKKMIFSPGTAADMPLVGDKMAIFSDKMSRYYNYTIETVEFNDTECYLFGVKIKPEYVDKKKRKTIIKELNTYFAKSDMQVMSRNYNLQYKNQLYSFDVDIDILLDFINDRYVPVDISYKGFWDLAFKKPEIAEFHISFYDF